MIHKPIQPEILAKKINEEVHKALGLSRNTWLRFLIDPLVARPVNAFAEISAEFEKNVVKDGFTIAAKRILSHFVESVSVKGMEKIPPEEPLLVISNHPGTCDSLLIASNIFRDDLKILAGNITFLKDLPATQNHLLHTTIDTYDRMYALRKALKHLKGGGTLLIFGSGGIDPDPAWMPGVEKEIDSWSSSIEFLIKKVPDVRVIVSIVSNVLSPRFINHPLTRVRKERRDRQRISEFLQVIQQLLSPGKLIVKPKVTFAGPIIPTQDTPEGISVLSHLKHLAKNLLTEHQHQISLPTQS